MDPKETRSVRHQPNKRQINDLSLEIERELHHKFIDVIETLGSHGNFKISLSLSLLSSLPLCSLLLRPLELSTTLR